MRLLLSLKRQDVLLPLLLLAFSASSVTFLRPLFNTTTRWVIIFGAILYLLYAGSLLRPLSTRFGRVLVLSWLWTALTVLWSEIPQLSLMKFVALVLVSLTGMAAGQVWVRQHEHTKWFSYLLPLTVVTLAAGILGRYSVDAEYNMGRVILYQGLVGGSNMFGSMLAMCSPFLMWQLYRHWPNQIKRFLWTGLGLIALYYLFRAGSRGAMLIVLFTGIGILLSLGAKKRQQLIILGLGGVVVVALMLPALGGELVSEFIYKGATKEQSVLITREQVWTESFRLAQLGGLFGRGYGVTIGDSEFSGGLTAIGYGREKANSQMAIMEEMGLVGLALYGVLLATLFVRLMRARRGQPPGDYRVILGLVIGALVGMTVSSVFEAWWVAPGSPESMYFWALVGIAMGIVGKSKHARRLRSPVSAPTVLQTARVRYRGMGRSGG